MNTATDWDVIVVGAGVLGAFHAYHAARRGLRTLLLERGALPREASVRNFGMVAPSTLPAGEWRDRAAESVEIYRRLESEAGLPVACRGTLYFATTPLELKVAEEFAGLHQGPENACRILAPDELRSHAPAANLENCIGGLYFSGDARVDPTRYVNSLIVWMAKSLGVEYRPLTVATAVDVHSGNCRLTTSSGEQLRAGRVFVCTGADLRILLPHVFENSGLKYCKLQMLRTEPQPGRRMAVSLASGLSMRHYKSFAACPSWAQLQQSPLDDEVRMEARQRGIHILVVQDRRGGFIVGDSHEYSDDGFDEQLNAATEQVILSEAKRILSPEHWRVEQRWCGIYTLHPARDVFRETIDERVHIITGIGGKGMTVGPALARESIDQIG